MAQGKSKEKEKSDRSEFLMQIDRKTTLLKCLAELVPYTEGEISLNGKSPLVFGIPNWRSKVMYVPQRPAVHPGTPMDLFNMAKKYSSQKGKCFDDPVSTLYD